MTSDAVARATNQQLLDELEKRFSSLMKAGPNSAERHTAWAGASAIRRLRNDLSDWSRGYRRVPDGT